MVRPTFAVGSQLSPRRVGGQSYGHARRTTDCPGAAVSAADEMEEAGGTLAHGVDERGPDRAGQDYAG